jgi:hypothetical protein
MLDFRILFRIKMAITLQEIWSTSNASLVKFGKVPSSYSLDNKIAMALFYSSLEQLSDQDKAIVDHPLFKEIALKIGRLDDIKDLIIPLLTLDPLFNELNLLSILGSFNGSNPKLYIINYDGLEIRSIGDVLERIVEVRPQLTNPVYHKGKVYMICHSGGEDPDSPQGNSELISVDSDNGDVDRFTYIHPNHIFGISGSLLYYKDNSSGLLFVLNIEDQSLIETEIKGHNLFIYGRSLYVLEVDDNVMYLNRYDLTTCYPTFKDRRFLEKVLSINYIKIVKGKLYLRTDKLYIRDLETFDLITAIDIPLSTRLDQVHEHDGILYYTRLSGSTISRYNIKTGQKLKDLVFGTCTFQTYLNGSKALVDMNFKTLQIFDLITQERLLLNYTYSYFTSIID